MQGASNSTTGICQKIQLDFLKTKDTAESDPSPDLLSHVPKNPTSEKGILVEHKQAMSADSMLAGQLAPMWQ
jgi:hypothetical protein